jgi:ATP-binding cassette subfamily C (CFTR/MRP) protein 1
MTDLWDIEHSETSQVLTAKLEKEWKVVADKYLKKLNKSLLESPAKEYKLEHSVKDENIILNPEVNLKSVEKKLKEPSLMLCVVKVFGGKFVAGSSLKLIQDLILLFGPTILGLLIDFVGDKRQSVQMGYFYACLLLFLSCVQTVALQHYFHRMFIVSVRIRTAFMNMIYKKSLVLSPLARKELNAGQMNNLMTGDSQMFLNLTMYVNMVWSAPLQIFVSLFLLWRQIGVSSLIGFATMFVFIPLNIFVTKKAQELRKAKLKFTDSRIKTTNEVLNGIKVIKLYGWEESFKNIIASVRDKELDILQKSAYLSVVTGLTAL